MSSIVCHKPYHSFRTSRSYLAKEETNAYLDLMENTVEGLRYPIGSFSFMDAVDENEINAAIEKIALFPAQLRKLIDSLTDDVLDSPYRPQGWTVRQVVHHCADSHMNAFIRFKLALTEEVPVIKPYKEALWAMQLDYNMDPAGSLVLVENLHARWVVLMKAMEKVEWDRGFSHPEYRQILTLKQIVMLYAWHGEHHLGHIRNAIESLPRSPH